MKGYIYKRIYLRKNTNMEKYIYKGIYKGEGYIYE